MSRDSTTTQPRWWLAIQDEVSSAAQIPILRSVALPPHARELRLQAFESLMIWRPIPLLRLVEWDDRVAGELYLYWPRLRDSTDQEITPYWVKHGQQGCRTVHQTAKWATCRIQPRRGTSWRAVADSMNALEVWELPPGKVQERLGSNATEQDGVMAELLTGEEYRRFRYYDLDRLTGPDVPRIRAAARLVQGLVPAD